MVGDEAYEKHLDKEMEVYGTAGRDLRGRLANLEAALRIINDAARYVEDVEPPTRRYVIDAKVFIDALAVLDTKGPQDGEQT